MSVEKIPPGKKVRKPHREPDMISKRGIPYWFGPDWVRNLNDNIGRLLPIKRHGHVVLCMVSKDGNATPILGSIQEEFLKWHEDRQVDAILLGFGEDSIIECTWEYTDA